MTAFEFVSVLLSIVVSLAFTHMLTGTARLIQAKRVRISLVYALWVLMIVFCCVDYWFSLWSLRDATEWPLTLVLFLLSAATVLYLVSWLIVPAEINDGIDLVAFHDDNRRKYVGAFCIYMLFGAVANSIIQGFQSAVLLSFGFAALGAAAWIWRDARIQWLAIAGLYIGVAYYCVTYISHL
jgi:hypothetical protein